MAQARAPRSRIAASNAWTCGASGVVCTAGCSALSPPIRFEMELMRPVAIPACAKIDSRSHVVVVLPLVPVTPTTCRSRLGSPGKAAASADSAARASGTRTQGSGAAAGGSTSATTERRAALYRVVDEIGAVEALPRYGDEDAARSDVTRIEMDAGHRRLQTRVRNRGAADAGVSEQYPAGHPAIDVPNRGLFVDHGHGPSASASSAGGAYRCSQTVTVAPGSTASPAAGAWRATAPSPLNSARRPMRPRTSTACRALNPRRSGIDPASSEATAERAGSGAPADSDQAAGRRSASRAGAERATSGGRVESCMRGTRRYRRAASAIRWKTGAAAAPPVYARWRMPLNHGGARRVQHDQDDEPRGIRRYESDERGIVVGVRIATVDELLRRAGLAGDRIAGHPGATGRSPLGDLRHDPGQRSRRLPRDRAPDHPSLRLHPATVAGHRANDTRLEELAAVRHRGEGSRHLQRGDGNLVPHGNGRYRPIVQRLGTPRRGRALSPGKSRDSARPNPNLSTYRLSRSGPRRNPTRMAPTLLDLTITSVKLSGP